MLISAIVAMALFAEPAASASAAGAAAAETAGEAKPAAAKPVMRRVCVKVAVENSKAPKKKCRMVPASEAPDDA